MTRRHNRWLISQCEYNTFDTIYHSVKRTANEHITFIQLCFLTFLRKMLTKEENEEGTNSN